MISFSSLAPPGIFRDGFWPLTVCVCARARRDRGPPPPPRRTTAFAPSSNFRAWQKYGWVVGWGAFVQFRFGEATLSTPSACPLLPTTPAAPHRPRTVARAFLCFSLPSPRMRGRAWKQLPRERSCFGKIIKKKNYLKKSVCGDAQAA